MIQLDRALGNQLAVARAVRIAAAGMPNLEERAAKTLDLLLEEIRCSPQPETAWEFGSLSYNGFPVEFTFGSHERGMRYATEVGGSEVKPQDRLSRAERLLDSLGAGRLPEEVSALSHKVQESGSLKWGAWMGVRHRLEGDRYKLYVEVPQEGSPAAAEMVRCFLGNEPLLPDGGAQLVAIGQETDLSRTEFYFRIKSPHLTDWQVTNLLQRVGLESRQADLFGLIEETSGYTFNRAGAGLPEGIYGFSFSFSLGAEPLVFSVFTFAKTLFKTDGSARHALLSLAQQKGWNLRNYAAFTEPLAGCTDPLEHHNVIAFLVAQQGPPALHISLSPPLPGINRYRHHSSSSIRSSVNSSVDAAIRFLCNARHPDGWWSDFRLAPGCSDEWVTGYTGTALASQAVPQALTAAQEAWRWLSTRCQPSGCWGYNSLTPRDADSTAWALQLADATGCGDWEQALSGREFLATHVRMGGGIATYATDGPIRGFIRASEEMSFDGWCEPQNCVTAAAASLPDVRAGACEFLRQRQSEDGSWKSYWWCEDEYATAQAAEALANVLQPEDRERVGRAVRWALSRISADGSVPSTVRPSGSPFATAWIVRILVLGGDTETVREPLERAVCWLLQQQNPDGSWPPSAGLRVPPPNITASENYQNWVLNGLIEGAISLDQHGIFTTATVLQALNRACSISQV